MFTGLIEEVGQVIAVEGGKSGCRMAVRASRVLENMSLGDSIAIDGACMTVVAIDGDSFSFEVSPESLAKTNFGAFTPGTRVNLERPLTPESRIGGHYVTGHVDGQAVLEAITPAGNSQIFTFRVDDPLLSELLVPKGSVAVLGISLTLNTVETDRFTVAIIPHTLAHTNLGDCRPGDRVNIETDLLGKYVRRLLFERTAGQAEIQIDAPTLVPALAAHHGVSAGVPPLPGSRMPSGTNIHTGGWFNHELES